MIEMVKTGGSTKESSYGNMAVSHIPDHLLTERVAIEAMKCFNLFKTKHMMLF